MCMCPLTVLSHELVELVQCLCVFGRRVVWWMPIWTAPAVLGVGGWCLAAIAAHKRWQNGRVVHPPIQSPEQCPHALGDNRWIAAAAAISVCTSSPYRK